MGFINITADWLNFSYEYKYLGARIKESEDVVVATLGKGTYVSGGG